MRLSDSELNTYADTLWEERVDAWGGEPYEFKLAAEANHLSSQEGGQLPYHEALAILSRMLKRHRDEAAEIFTNAGELHARSSDLHA